MELHQQMVKDLAAKKRHPVPRDLEHGVDGLVTEAGELQDHLKRAKWYGTPVDKPNILEECGDALYYIVLILQDSGFTLEDALQCNTAKLRKRYPNGAFNIAHALNRDLEGEREILESHNDE